MELSALVAETNARCDKMEQMLVETLGKVLITERMVMHLWCRALEQPMEAATALHDLIMNDFRAVHLTTTACPEKAKPYREEAQRAFDRARALGLVEGEGIPYQVKHLWVVPPPRKKE